MYRSPLLSTLGPTPHKPAWVTPHHTTHTPTYTHTQKLCMWDGGTGRTIPAILLLKLDISTAECSLCCPDSNGSPPCRLPQQYNLSVHPSPWLQFRHARAADSMEVSRESLYALWAPSAAPSPSKGLSWSSSSNLEYVGQGLRVIIPSPKPFRRQQHFDNTQPRP